MSDYSRSRAACGIYHLSEQRGEFHSCNVTLMIKLFFIGRLTLLQTNFDVTCNNMSTKLILNTKEHQREQVILRLNKMLLRSVFRKSLIKTETVCLD